MLIHVCARRDRLSALMTKGPRYNMFTRLIVAAFCVGAMFTAAARKPRTSPPSRAHRARRTFPALNGLAVAVGRCVESQSLRNVIVHQTEGPAGSARYGAREQAKNPMRRGVTVWVETDGTVYWAVPEKFIPTHGDGANRNDNKYIDNGPTFHQVLKENSIGVEFAGNYPDVAKPASAEQIAAWRILLPVLQARYRIPAERVYAHNWIDYKDARYCEGCDLATLARSPAFSARP